MSRPERVGRLLRQIEHETQAAFDEHTELFNLNNQLKAENAKLRELVRNLYKRFHGVVLENWSYSTEDFDMLACRMRELGIEVEE